MKILIAPNTFKHSLSADSVALAIQEGFMQSSLECACECFPIGDGGDGTGELIIKKCKGQIIQSKAHDPLGRKITASFGLINEGRTAVVEMAAASGLRLLKKDELNPMIATSFGTGEQMKAALDAGATKIILAMGGSATVDGGTGILKALGVKFLNSTNEELENLPGSLVDLHSIDVSSVDTRIFKCELIVLCDVDNFLLGKKGAAAMFGPQKGASPDAVKKLDAGLTRFAQVASAHCGRELVTLKYGGTAGGAATGMHAILNAKLVHGIEYFLGLTEFDASLQNADLVVTGEGSIDEQTLQGKGPFGVAYRAKLKGLPVIGLAGQVPLYINQQLQKYFDVLLPITNEPGDLTHAILNTANNLRRTARELGNLIAISKR